MKKKIVAAIDIGSSSIRMIISEIIDGEVEVIDSVRHTVRLGKDSFYKGKIFRTTIDECIEILSRYKRLCDEYGVKEIKAVATTAVREATNSDIFLDNIFTYTGINVEIISAYKETEYIHKVLSKRLKDTSTDNYKCIAEVGTGSVEITIFDNNFIIYSTSLPIGALKAKQFFTKEYYQLDSSFSNYLNIIVEHELRVLKRSIPCKTISKIYGVGAELEQLSIIMNKNTAHLTHIKKEELETLCKNMQSYSKEEIIHKLNVSYDLAENFYAVSTIFLSIINFFDSNEIFIPNITLKDCLIVEMACKMNKEKYFNQLQNQIQINSQNIGKSFNYDENHALKVLELSLKLFDQTKNIHRLSEYEKCYLIASAILHDVGLAISNRDHHKHSLYIIKSQNFYYFNEKDRKIIANVARYHRKSSPKQTHADYMALSKDERMCISKVSAILRIADSLDSHHLQLIEDIEVFIKKNKLQIIATIKDNIYAEIYSFNVKKDLFEDFFGYSVQLETKKLVK
ncbi:MAG: hypothetical protein A2015_10475 [Spirochaetes bacterium GWF1_31_7]|nr:MAG: hypothetical protein A2Y30_16215 [Spirochaetes bacterium GWE1_32_154]OHD48523.1 MAG: hypothetical protein A2Y29_14190 [Spirochaetes bacterium GWE2_31_10]OHD51438.1 MAG: hypothetical protein A2015_10475 [Spirochaetes bacterium GWF1_31_7]OHD73700.1 MAG: hypothetical protein A2355_01385 [Spirochaetes bacterium RIFOXYB1_FULL_32_8]HBD93347.1 hypothetical protein [Spirochaetia bacterium]